MTVLEPFTPDGPFRRHMADGHRIRTGHDLVGHYVTTDEPGVARLVRTCCGPVDEQGQLTITPGFED